MPLLPIPTVGQGGHTDHHDIINPFINDWEDPDNLGHTVPYSKVNNRATAIEARAAKVKYVTDYGTVYGDQSHDDATVFQAALSDLHTGEVLILPPVLCIGVPVHCYTDGVSLRGWNMGGAHTEQTNTAKSARIEILASWTGGSTVAALTFQAGATPTRTLGYVTLENLTVDGGGTSGTPIGTGITGIQLNANRSHVNRCAIKFMSGDGFKMTGLSSSHTFDTKLDNFEIANCLGVGLNLDSFAADVQVSGGNIHGNNVNIRVAAGAPQISDLQVYNAVNHSTPSGCAHGGINILFDDGGSRAQMCNLKIEGSDFEQIVFRSASNGITDVDFSDCRLKDGSRNNHGQAPSIRLVGPNSSSIQRARFRQCTFVWTGSSPILGSSTANGAGSSSTSLTVASGSSFPASGAFLVSIAGGADVTVNSRSGNVLTLAVAQTWSNGASVAQDGGQVSEFFHLGDATWPSAWGGNDTTGGHSAVRTEIFECSFGDGNRARNTHTSTGNVIVDNTSAGSHYYSFNNIGLADNRYDFAASSATPTINTDRVDYYELTALTTNPSFSASNVTGTPARGQTLTIAMTATSGSKTVTWDSSIFEAGNVPLPGSVSTSTLVAGFRWNSVTSKWRCNSAGSGALTPPAPYVSSGNKVDDAAAATDGSWSNSAGCTMTLAAGSYLLGGIAAYFSTSVADIRFRLTAPSDATGWFQTSGLTSNTSGTSAGSQRNVPADLSAGVTGTQSVGEFTDNARETADFHGFVTLPSGGTITVQYAQDTATGGVSTFLGAGSVLTATTMP